MNSDPCPQNPIFARNRQRDHAIPPPTTRDPTNIQTTEYEKYIRKTRNRKRRRRERERYRWRRPWGKWRSWGRRRRGKPTATWRRPWPWADDEGAEEGRGRGGGRRAAPAPHTDCLSLGLPLSLSLSLLSSLSLSLLFSAGSGFGGSFLSFFFFFFGKNISKMQKRLVVQVANWRKKFFGGLLALVGHFPTLFCVCSYTLNILYDLGKSIIQKNGNHFSSHIWFTFRNHRKDLYHLRSINWL